MQIFADRADAGRQLAEKLTDYANNPQAVVLALPRGGVPVGYEVARRIGVPLDLYVVRKLGVPGHEELAMGALASDGTCVVDEDLIATLGIDEAALEDVVRREIIELRRRESAYRDSPHPDLSGKIVIVVDDGLPPVQRCARPRPRCENVIQRRSSRAYRWPRPVPARACEAWSIALSASPRPNRFMPSDSTIEISSRRATTTYDACWPPPPS